MKTKDSSVLSELNANQTEPSLAATVGSEEPTISATVTTLTSLDGSTTTTITTTTTTTDLDQPVPPASPEQPGTTATGNYCISHHCY